jgi:hypothetical protein
MDRRKASSVVSTERNRRRFERQMLRVAAMIVIAVLGELVSEMYFGLPRIYGLFLRKLSSGEYLHVTTFRIRLIPHRILPLPKFTTAGYLCCRYRGGLTHWGLILFTVTELRHRIFFRIRHFIMR